MTEQQSGNGSKSLVPRKEGPKGETEVTQTGALVPVAVSNAAIESKRLEIKRNWSGAMSDKLAYQMAKLSASYGLDPFLKELVVLGDNVYPTAAALHRKANEDPNYDGEELRPANEAERKAFYYPAAPPEDEHLWVCYVHHRARKHPAVGWGRASKANVKMSTMQIWLPEMAQKRARGRAYRIYFNIGIPVVEEMYEFEDGTTMERDPRKEIEYATKEQLEMLETRILKKEYLDKGLVLKEEWEKIVGQTQKKLLTKEQADIVIKMFLGPEMDGKEGKLRERHNASKSDTSKQKEQ